MTPQQQRNPTQQMTEGTKSAPSTTRRSGSSIATHPQPHTATADKSHSYITHLLEDGFDHLFVQQPAGHSWGSTTAVYTTIGSDYKNRALRRALDRAFTDPAGH